MKFTALSIIQPWPWLILRPDVTDAVARGELVAARRMKDCENREWETSFRGWALVHASSTRLAKWDYAAAALFAVKRGVDVPLRESLPYGAIVGAVRVDACEWSFRSPWAVGPRMFVFGAAVPFATSIYCAGKPKFFEINAVDVGAGCIERIAAAVRAAGLARAFKLPEAPPSIDDTKRNDPAVPDLLQS